MRKKLKPGDKLAYLTLIERITNKNQRPAWVCQCDCGKIVTRREDYLSEKKHENRVFSCGCQHPAWNSLGNKSKSWRGYEEISGHFFAMLKKNAELRDLEILVSREYMWELFIKQDRKCAISGIPIQFCQSYRKKHLCGEPTASLDRIDSSKGYVDGNVQWVHKDINLMKNYFPEDKFLEYCKIISDYQNNKSKD